MESRTGPLRASWSANLPRAAFVGALWAFLLARAQAAEEPGTIAAQHVPRMSYLDNGVIRLGVDLNLGGAITYLSPSGKELNLINTHDWGRQVQLSFYSGPVPFHPPGTRMSRDWEFIGWNPIQSGDCYGHESRVLKHSNTGKRIYLRCVPMHWPLDNVPGECDCEVWLELSGPAVKARCRLNNHRPDRTQYPARHQELPAVYVNGPFYRLMTYTGDKPFSGDAPARIEKRPGESGPWSQWIGTENWAAQVNDSGWGLGVWNPGAFEFTGGFAGKPGAGGALDNPTGYIAPIRAEILDHDIVYEYSYELIVGTLDEIRNYVRRNRSNARLPAFRFASDRQGWFYRNATDSGWPVRHNLDIELAQPGAQVISPVFFAKSQNAPKLKFECAVTGASTNGPDPGVRVFWRKLGQAGFTAEQSTLVPLRLGDRLHKYEVNLGGFPAYTGAIIQIRLDPVPAGQPGPRFKLRSLSLTH